MTLMMLTALNETTDRVLDVTTMLPAVRDSIHGRRTATRNGYDMVCRHCYHGVHLVSNHHGRLFWRHNPGAATACIMAEAGHGESGDHITAKAVIARSLRSLTGWTATFEERFDHHGDAVIDVETGEITSGTDQPPLSGDEDV